MTMEERIGVYEILEIPASGTFGVVCIARAPDGRTVAIKVLMVGRSADAGSLRRARDEARLLSRLDHPNLVRVDPVLQVNGRPCVIMEYVEGVTLAALLQARPAGVPPAIALAIVRDAARGLDAAWSTPTASDNRPMRVVHRDIKPGNLMLAVDGAVKVVDFGLAKATFADREAQSAAFVPSSRGYMAPERYDGLDTPKGDVYALGLTLIELLTGRKPVISLRMDRHDAMIDAAWGDHGAAAPPGVDTASLRALYRQMCAYEDRPRPEPHEVAARLDALLAAAHEPPDLAAFALSVVAPLHAARPLAEPTAHPRYADVRFLEEEPTVEGERFDPDSVVRRYVASSDFPGRASEIAAMLAANPKADLKPLLSVLDGASAPPWMFWRRPPPSEHTVAALHAVAPVATPPILDRARRLSRHRDQDIARAARQLLERATPGG
jgi:serine/threonine protein kinase